MIRLPSPEQRVFHPLFETAGVELWIKRDDLIHPEISGNKWRKLAPIMEEIKKRGVTKVISYGGAWSNHLLALAAAAHQLGMDSMGIVRGEPVDNSILSRCSDLGMKIRFLSREEYRNLRKVDDVLGWTEDTCIIPEGANCPEARQGMATLWSELKQDYTYLLDSVGSGTSVRGLSESAPSQTRVLAIMAVKDHGLAASLRAMGIRVFDEYTRGGFAKMDDELFGSCRAFREDTGILLDPVYTAKQWMAALDLLDQGLFNKGDRVLFVHSGGLSGWGADRP
ncbi:MAG TPA: 1-aminocyclopropane-1-carboxylate deaminase [Bacteroidetes bacterium]|nr:1-aminocyclopropane-1-carboxylate deaminase [Bacteroidota bacterium]